MARTSVRAAVADVAAIAVRAGSLVVSRGPILLALYLAGELARYEVVRVVGWVGAYSALGGSLLFPFIILCRLVPLVAMLLVLRGGMPQLARVSAPPPAGVARRREFLSALLAGTLPFVAFYAGWGFLREDAQAYYLRVLEISTAFLLNDEVLGQANPGDAANGDLTFGPVSGAVLIAALLLRLAYSRWGGRMPRLVGLAAVYLEALWVFLSAILITDAVDAGVGWIGQRQVVAWIEDAYHWLGAQLAPLAWLWDGVAWLIGEIGQIAGEPLAWLVVAGVVYGQVVVRPRSGPAGATALARRVRGLVDAVREQIAPIVRAVVLLWRSGPVLVGSYIVLYTVLLAGRSLLDIGLTRVIGPHPRVDWQAISALVFLIAPTLLEPLRVSLVAGAYDTAIGIELRTATPPPPFRPGVDAQPSSANLRNAGAASGEDTSSVNGPVPSGTRYTSPSS